MAGRRNRGLSAEDRALWEKVAAGTRPLQPGPAPVADSPTVSDRKPEVVALEVAGPRTVRPGRAEMPRTTLDLAPDPRSALGAAHPVMDRRRFDKLRRGRLEPEARLDLHGMTAERAHAVLRTFIVAAHEAGLRLVLVITGKGRLGEADAVQPQRHGILRHAVPHWLAAPPLVGRILQIVPAHQRHGGGGAYYIYLRRQR